MPVLLAGREPDDIAGPNLLDGAALALCPTEAGGDDESLSEGMGVPGGACSGLEGDARDDDARGVGWGGQRVDAYCSGEPVSRPFGGGLRACSFDFHIYSSLESCLL